jgi:L-aminopeptidase/D-esterase-like protein
MFGFDLLRLRNQPTIMHKKTAPAAPPAAAIRTMLLSSDECVELGLVGAGVGTAVGEYVGGAGVGCNVGSSVGTAVLMTISSLAWARIVSSSAAKWGRRDVI